MRCETTGSYFSQVLLRRDGGGGVTRAEGADRVKEGRRAPLSSGSWTENTLTTDRTWESGYLQSMCTL